MNNGLSAIDYYTTALAPYRKSLIYFSDFFYYQIYRCLINAEEEILNATSNF